MTSPRPGWRPTALWSLLLLLCAAGLALTLLTLLHAHLNDPALTRFDLRMQTAVHGWANPALDRIMRSLTWIGSIKIFACALAVAVVILLRRGKTHAAALLGLPMLGALFLNETLKLHFHRARPTVPWAIGDEHTFSFPSGHSLFAVVLYGCLAYLLLRRPLSTSLRFAVGTLAVLMPLGIGLSRIYLGMHFPTDVLAGYTVGAIWLAATITVDRMWRPAGHAGLNPRL